MPDSGHLPPLFQPLWREARRLFAGWRQADLPDRWNPFFIRELRRGSWKDGLVPRVALMQLACAAVWGCDVDGWWALPVVSSLATVLLEARAAAADHRSPAWELVRVTGRTHTLWWKGWKTLHLVNLLAALSTLLPWAIIVNLTRGGTFDHFWPAAFLCIPASCLALRRWTAFGFSTTPWKRRTLMGSALVLLEPMMTGAWGGLVFLYPGHFPEGLILAAFALFSPLLFSFYTEGWLLGRLRCEAREEGRVNLRILLLVIGCILSLLSFFGTATLVFFIVMEVNLNSRRQARNLRIFSGAQSPPELP